MSQFEIEDISNLTAIEAPRKEVITNERKCLRMSTWKHVNTILGNQELNISGAIISNNQWMKTGEKITVNDPLYGNERVIDVYEAQTEGKKIIFAAGEFSNSVWVIFQEI